VRTEEAADSAPGSAPPQQPRAAETWPHRLGAALRPRLTLDHLLALVLGLLVLVVHNLTYVLRLPFWLDESWVAVTTRFPLSQLRAVTNSTPIGWTALLRVVTIPGTQSPRLLPLAFAGLAVVIAYWLGRQLGWPLRTAAVCAGVLAGAAALLVPAMLIRDDLKQYTADACLALLVLALTSRLERDWSRRRLVALSVASWGGMLFSQAVTFVGISAFAALCVVQLARRSWAQFREACVAAAVTGVLMFGVYEAFDASAAGDGLDGGAHMQYYFLPLGSIHAAASFVVNRFDQASVYFGLGPSWLAVPLVVAGIATMFWLRRPVTALAFVLLWPIVLAVNAVRRYPFLELRTNTYLFALTAVVAAIGAIGVSSWLPRAVTWTARAARKRSLPEQAAGTNPGPPRRRPWYATAMAVWLACACVAAGSGFAWAARPYMRVQPIPDQDMRGQTQYVFTHAASDDVILVDTTSSFGFAYYWPVGRPAQRLGAAVAQQYEPYFPSQPRIVVALNVDADGVDPAVSRAAQEARSRSCARIWLVTSQESPARWAEWTTALAQRALRASPVAAAPGLYVVKVSGPGCP